MLIFFQFLPNPLLDANGGAEMFKFSITFLMVAVFVPSLVYAAPFCVRTAYGTNCHYYDANQCRDDARINGGMCISNTESSGQLPRMRSMGAPFCVQSGYGTNCHYYDANQCRDAARMSGGMCISNPDN